MKGVKESTLLLLDGGFFIMILMIVMYVSSLSFFFGDYDSSISEEEIENHEVHHVPGSIGL